MTFTSTSSYAPPLSGQIIGAAVKELRFEDDALTDRTARRYFAGERIKDDGRLAILEALGQALIDRRVIPASPFLERRGMPYAKAVAVGIAWYAEQWDNLAGYMRSASAAVDRPELAATSYLRLAIVDLSLRVSAALFLADAPTPSEEPPLWAKDNGGGLFLRQLLARCGDGKPTRDALAERLEVSVNTVDNWLDADTRPSLYNMSRLARELAPLIPDADADALEGDMRLHYALRALSDMLAKHLGRDVAMDLAAALVRFVSRNLAGLRTFSNLEPDAAAKSQFFILLTGARFAGAEHLLKYLWRHESDPIWRADLLAASKPWHLRLSHVAKYLGGLDEVAKRAHEEYGIPMEDVGELLDEVLQAAQTDLTRLDFADESELENANLIRVKGNAEFSANNRMIQYAQARAENDLETALVHIRRAAALQPENARYHFELGGTLVMAGKVEAGIMECRRAANLAPEWELPQVEVGIILLNAGRNQEAREHLENMARGKKRPSAHLAFNLGVSRERCGDPAGALEMLERVIRINKEHALAIDHAAYCAFLTGDAAKGARLAKRADALGQSDTYREWIAGKYRAARRPR